MQVNRPIIVATAIIMATGAYVVLRQPGATHTRTLTRVIVGGYVLAVLVSIIDLVGGPASTIATGLLMLALMTALFAVLPDLLSRFRTQPSAAAVSSGAGAHPTVK